MINSTAPPTRIGPPHRQQTQGREHASPCGQENESAERRAVVGASERRADIPDHETERGRVEQDQERQRGTERDRGFPLPRHDA